MKLRTEDHVLAGFFISTPIERPACSDETLLPKTIVSLSSCLSSFFPDSSCLSWCSADEAAKTKLKDTFGIDVRKHALKALEQSFSIDFGWESVIYSLSKAREFASYCSLVAKEIHIYGAALHAETLDDFLAAARPTAAREGFAPEGAHGTYEVLCKNQEVPEPEQILGYEPLVFNYGLSCSWLCNGLEKTCYEDLGFKPNSHGLLASYAEARDVCRHIRKDHIGAEPGLWLPWLICDYGSITS